ncbi:hypothetical protein HMPREF1042_1539 [Streptococcus constellatus subsp. pharyngis SK1060 = CCUG 46377]|uniref:Uncharacterized protein n=1 Tax=Streptococcus constellatus subsp. pharyngis SK1060 = CCUG 46377 TaxID=1035184 RepID=F9P8I4_STRCV|nr:hypothetical protein HMPREF1042_1539 [Streptococcus constellatus subsp. pharyngis SK1060 = CCUG 46377]
MADNGKNRLSEIKNKHRQKLRTAKQTFKLLNKHWQTPNGN